MSKRGTYFYLNLQVGPELKARLVERAQQEQLSLGNLVLRELAANYRVPVEFGQDRVPKACRGDQLFLLAPPMVDWRLAAEANRTRTSKSAVARRILRSALQRVEQEDRLAVSA